jgi:hypothetical protein
MQILTVTLAVLVGGCASRSRTVEGEVSPTTMYDRSGTEYEVARLRIMSKVEWRVNWERAIIEMGHVTMVDSHHRVIPLVRLRDASQVRWRGRLMRVVELTPDARDTVGGRPHIGTRRQEYELPSLAFVVDDRMLRPED